MHRELKSVIESNFRGNLNEWTEKFVQVMESSRYGGSSYGKSTVVSPIQL